MKPDLVNYCFRCGLKGPLRYGGFIDGRFHYLCRQCHVAQTRDAMTADREKRQEVKR